MENPSVSPIEDINAAIQSHNPFSNAGIVKEQDIWGKGFPDVPTLNAHASDTVFQAIELVRTSQSSQDKVTSIAITAQYGVGKTHLLSRIRHRLEREGGALFVYAGVNNYTDLNLVKYQFQQTLADSLSKTGSQGVMQWQEVAAAIANDGIMMEPYLIDTIRDDSGELLSQVIPKMASTVVEPKSAEELRLLFKHTVTSGTSRRAFRQTVRRSAFDEVEFGGKTGSSKRYFFTIV